MLKHLDHEIPKYYTWNKSTSVFKRRLQGTTAKGCEGIKSQHALGSVYTIDPNMGEVFSVRLLRHTVRGPTTFQALVTFQCRVFTTLKLAYLLHDLLKDDMHWKNIPEEAAIHQSPRQFRDLVFYLRKSKNFQEYWLVVCVIMSVCLSAVICKIEDFSSVLVSRFCYSVCLLSIAYRSQFETDQHETLRCSRGSLN